MCLSFPRLPTDSPEFLTTTPDRTLPRGWSPRTAMFRASKSVGVLSARTRHDPGTPPSRTDPYMMLATVGELVPRLPAVLTCWLYAGAIGAAAIYGDGGTIVGYGKNYLNLDRAFRWTESTGRQDLGTLAGSTANALAVSADGSVIVGYAAAFEGEPHAFRWTSAGACRTLKRWAATSREQLPRRRTGLPSWVGRTTRAGIRERFGGPPARECKTSLPSLQRGCTHWQLQRTDARSWVTTTAHAHLDGPLKTVFRTFPLRGV